MKNQILAKPVVLTMIAFFLYDAFFGDFTRCLMDAGIALAFFSLCVDESRRGLYLLSGIAMYIAYFVVAFFDALV